MVSQENEMQTKEFFERKKYFNYSKDKIIFFKQGKNPILNLEGKLVLENKYTIREAANGNGDVFRVFEENNIVQLLNKNKIKYISFCGIDNILAKTLDPVFIGMLISKKYEIASKSIFKEHSLEKTAVFCNIDKRPNILGYNNITKEISDLKDENGRYLYRDENILLHLMTVQAIEKIAKVKLGYHRVFRKNTYLDINSKQEKYVTENSFKFEKFIFDAFKYFDKMLLLRVNKSEEFAPIKNTDNINRAIDLYLKYKQN